MAAERTSIQRLQALESDHPQLEDQIREIRKFLRWPSQAEYETSNKSEKQSQPYPRSHGKAEWILRWLLKKLRGEGESGTRARACPELWSVLSEVPQSLPWFLAARVLHSHKFVKIIQTSITDFLKGLPSEYISEDDFPTGANDISDGLPAHNANIETFTNAHSRKRKRDPESNSRNPTKTAVSVESGSPGQNGLSLSAFRQRWELLSSIAECLKTFVTMAQELGDDYHATASEYVCSVFRLDYSQAAELLGRWLAATMNLNYHQPPGWHENDMILNDLNPVLFIWEKRVFPGENSGANIRRSFIQSCLAPLTVFLGLADINKEKSRMNALDDLYNEENRRIVERILQKNLLLPARAEFYDPSRELSGNARSMDVDTSDSSNEQLFQPLKSIILSPPLVEGQNKADMAASCIPALFSNALRSARLMTPNDRIAEQPWVERILLELSACMGLDVDSGSSAPSHINALKYLVRMLQALGEQKIPVRYDILRSYVEAFGKLAKDGDQNVPWSLIASIIELDANVFIDSDRNRKEQQENKRNNLAELLMSSIAPIRYPSTKVRHRHTFQDSLGSLDRYWLVKDKILVPICRAYASARSLKSFLYLWRSSLANAANSLRQVDGEEILDPEQSLSSLLLDDHRLDHALADHLEVSMTTAQISELIIGWAKDLRGELALPKPNIGIMYATARLLCALLYSVRSDETLFALVPTMADLMDCCLVGVKLKSIRISILPRMLWRLVRASHRVQSRFSGPRDESNFSPTTPGNKVDNYVERITNYLPTIPRSISQGEYLDTLMCLGSILSDLNRQNMDTTDMLKLSSASIRQYLEMMNENDSMSLDPECATVLVQHPILLKLREDTTAGGVPRQQLLRSILELDVRTIPNHTTADEHSLSRKFWDKIIQRALQEFEWLTTDIVNLLRDLRLEIGSRRAVGPKLDGVTRCIELSYLQIPAELIARKEKIALVDDLLKMAERNGECFEIGDWSRRFSLLIRFIEDLPAGAIHSLSSSQIFRISAKFDESVDGNPETMGETKRGILLLLKELVGQFIASWRSEFADHESHALLLDLVRKCGFSQDGSSVAMTGASRLAIVSKTLEVLSNNQENNSDLKANEITLQDELCSELCRDATNAMPGFYEDHNEQGSHFFIVSYTLEILPFLHSQVLQRHQFAIHSVRTAVQNALAAFDNENPEGSIISQALAALDFHLESKIATDGPEQLDVSAAAQLLRRKLGPYEQAIVQNSVIHGFESLNERERVDTIKDMLENCRNAGKEEALSLWCILHILVATSVASKPKNSLVPVTLSPTLLISLSSYLAAPTDIHVFDNIASTMITLLRHRDRFINQASIEATLLGIATVATPSNSGGPSRLSEKHAPAVFNLLTTMLRILLIQHRRQLRGRFDLLLMPLQRLLRCLFVFPHPPNTTFKNTLDFTERPDWLGTNAATSPLKTRHAERYARLLTSFCDPTAASVVSKSSKSRSSSRVSTENLTDEVAVARTYAGQYVPAILLLLCELQLQGRFAEDGMRDEIAPGVYVMFDAMGKEVLDACNEGLAVPSGVKTVLKGWWDEWKRERGRRRG